MASAAKLLALSGAVASASTVAAPAPNPDAQLIALCAEHIANRTAFNDNRSDLDPEHDPLWIAYERTWRAIDASKSQTLEGALAKARAAKAEARTLNGTENPEGTTAADWAWDVINDLVRIHGRA